MTLVLSSALIGACSPASRAQDAPLATVGAQAITQKDVNALIDQYYREAALKALIRKTLIDQQAAKAGVSLSDDDLTAGFQHWKKTTYGDDDAAFQLALGREGLTPALYLEAFREGVIARKIVAKTTILDDSDFDKVTLSAFIFKTPAEAKLAFETLRSHQALGRAFPEPPEMLPPIIVQRYDNRFSEAGQAALFTNRAGTYFPPIPWADPPGYLAATIAERHPGVNLPTLDRQVWAPGLLQRKTEHGLQEWWVALEKQVQLDYAAAAAPK